MSEGTDPILRARNLTTSFESSQGVLDRLLGRPERVRAVDGVDLDLFPGETLGIVGESGCGKTTLGRSLLRLTEPTAGSVQYRGEDLTAVGQSRLRDLRTELQYLFQKPGASLNPNLSVGELIGEPLDIHGIATGQERSDRIVDLLETVGLNPRDAHRYPHEFSTGQRQRIAIARTLAVDPEVIVCDEPVSALDVSVQAQILTLLEDLQADLGLSYIFIAHDLRVVEHISDRVAVLYLGELAEVGRTEDVFSPPHHPYTEALLSAIPEPDPRWDGDQIRLSGTVPSSIDPPSGCRFHTRCPRIIQPSDFDLDQTVWRSIVDFTNRLADADQLERLTARTDGANSRIERMDRTDVTREQLDRLVRERFSLPRTLSEPRAEQLLTDVIGRLHAGDFDGARSRCRDAFQSPCEVNAPDLLPTSATHEIACHLYDDARK